MGVDRVGGEPGHDQRHAPACPPREEAKVMTGKTLPEHGPPRRAEDSTKYRVLDT